MNRSLKVFFACALGAGIGAMIALQIGGYLWWIGMIIGATLGYLSYEFKAVLKAIVFAWRKIINYKLNWADIKVTLKLLFWVAIIIVCFCFLSFLRAYLEKNPLSPGSKAAILPIWFIFGFVIPILLALNDPIPALKFFLSPIILPLKFLIWVIEWAIKITKIILMVIAGLFTEIFLAMKAIFSFFKTIFVQIHSDERLLCFFDAGIGAGIGYFYHNALIGAIAGGILGAVNYELVSKRWLKLVPARS